MAKNPEHRDLFPGALEIMILQSLRLKPMHGYALVKHIKQVSDNLLQVEEGSLYPALYRLELDGAIAARWGVSENNRKAKYYQITRRGRKLLAAQEQTWNKLSTAVQTVLAR